MIDRETIMTWLKKCGNGGCSSRCPYDDLGPDKCYETLLTDALELLKRDEQTIESLERTIDKLTKAIAEKPEQKFFVDSDGKITPLPIQPHWISVKDRLPDKQPCECLVVNANNVETAICLDNRWITPRRVIKITHWMPLPTPPEVKQDD